MPVSTPQSLFAYQKWTSGSWYTASSSSSTSNLLGNTTVRVAPIYIPNAVTLSAIAGEITGAGSAGSVFRLGIWRDNGNGFPGNLLLDAGTIDGTSVTVQSITISQAVVPGLYWIGGACQGTPTTDPTVRTLALTTTGFGQLGNSNTTAPTATTMIGYSTGSAGALSNWSGNMTSLAGSIPRVALKVS